jgi:hypothetical protein
MGVALLLQSVATVPLASQSFTMAHRDSPRHGATITAMAAVRMCMRLRRTGVPGYEVVEYRRLARVPQLGAIIETVVDKKEEGIRARVMYVHVPDPGKAGEYTIYLDEVEG